MGMIIITDMNNLPHSCHDCRVNCGRFFKENGEYKRHPDCPLKEVSECEDCISRKTLETKILENYENKLSEHDAELFVEFMAFIDEDVPSVYPKNDKPSGKWIPVSERLPEKDESVLLTICANSSLYGFNENFVKVMCGSYSPCEDKRDWIVNKIRYYIDNVIAWQPLPKPYEPQESEVEE